MSITLQNRPSYAPPAASSFAMRALALGYGSLAYLIFLGTFLYAIGFVSQFVVSKTIDTGSTSSSPAAFLIDLALMSIFAVQHSGMARQGFKKLLAKVASPVIERSTYVLLASVALIVLFWQWQPIPTVVWNIDNPPFATLVVAASFLGWLIVLYSTFLISHFELFGLTQVVTHFAGRLTAPVKFKTPGLYRLVRHPDLSRIHHRVLVCADYDAGTPAVRSSDDSLYLRRHLPRGTRSDVRIRRRVPALSRASCDAIAGSVLNDKGILWRADQI